MTRMQVATFFITAPSRVKRFLLTFLQNSFVYKPLVRRLGARNTPLPIFDTVFFEVRTKCNGTCDFCAASIHSELRKDTFMSRELYEKVLLELKQLGFSGRIAYHINSEPLLFPELPDFVRLARKYVPGSWIQILTNGKSISNEIATQLLESSINELSINYYNDDLSAELPRNIVRVRDEVLPRFYDSANIGAGFGPDKQNKNIFRFNIFRRRLSDILETRGGTSPNKRTPSCGPRGFCQYPFTQLNITTDGRVSKCCCDLYFADPMGNVNDTALIDIWEGERFTRVRKSLLSNERQPLQQCRNCDFYGIFGREMGVPSRLGKFIFRITQ